MTPKSGKTREIPLGDDVLASLKRHRHFRGEVSRGFASSGPPERSLVPILKRTFKDRLLTRGNMDVRIIGNQIGTSKAWPTIDHSELNAALRPHVVHLIPINETRASLRPGSSARSAAQALEVDCGNRVPVRLQEGLPTRVSTALGSKAPSPRRSRHA